MFTRGTQLLANSRGFRLRVVACGKFDFWSTHSRSLNQAHASFRHFSSSDMSSSLPVNKANIEYCVDLVKKHDLENYLIGTLHVPRQFRTSFFAIHSFNIEMALIRSQGMWSNASYSFINDSVLRIYCWYTCVQTCAYNMWTPQALKLLILLIYCCS